MDRSVQSSGSSQRYFSAASTLLWKAMAGTKRGAGPDPSPRPKKIRRLGSNPSDVGDAMAMELRLADAAKTENGTFEPALVFLTATAKAVSAYDWSELIGVLDAEELLSVRRRDDDDLVVNVPGAVRRVPISKRVILKEILDHLGLRSLGYGIVLETKDIIRCWIDIEIPASGVCSARGRKRFYSDEAFTRSEASESACDAAISYLRSACFVVVEDINYGEVRALQKRALAAETWSTLLTDALDGGKKNNKAIRDAYASFFVEAKGLCKDFGDVLGPGIIGMASTSAAPGDERLYYGGPRPPISHAERFAFSLVDLINRGGDVAMLNDDMVAG